MVELFTRYGLADFAQRQGLTALTPRQGTEEADDAVSDRAVAFRKRLVELGPAYVKLGQALSTRPDLLPPEYTRELERLQDDVPAVPFPEIGAVIEQEFGARVQQIFADFDEEPLGAASLGQVHVAHLRDGREVVVKVQRPGIREQLASDLDFFRDLAAFLTEHTHVGERIDFAGVMHELERALSDELDYRIEARNTTTFRAALAGFPHLVVPRVVDALTSERVLTLERIRGIKVDQLPPLTRLEHDFTALAEELGQAYLKQITVDGHFHADPHPGNIFVTLPGRRNPPTPADVKDGAKTSPDEPRLALVDFGMTAHLSEKLREQVVRLLLDLAENRGDSAAETLVEMGQETEGFDHSAFVRETASLVSRYYDRAIGEVSTGTVMYELINTAFRHGLRAPGELTLLGKALVNLDDVTRVLDPGYNPVAAIREFGGRIAGERMKRELSLARVYQAATVTADLVAALPRRIDAITARLAANELGMRVELPQAEGMLAALQKIANRIFSGLVVASVVVASALVLPRRPALGVAGFVLAGALGLYMVVTILATDRRRKTH